MKYVGWLLLGILIWTNQLVAGAITIEIFEPEVSSTVGTYTSFRLRYTAAGALSENGKIKIIFPAGFNVDDATIGTFNDLLSPAVLDGGLIPEYHLDGAVVLKRDGTGTSIPGSAVIDLSFGNVLLPNTPGTFTVTIETRDPGLIDNVINGGAFSVVSGTFHHFKIEGYPTSKVAGINFTGNNIIVSARDINDNLVTNYTGKLYFTSSDASAIVPYTSASQYTFIVGDGGTKTFTGAGFTLKTAGNQTISAVAASSGNSWASNYISVSPAAVTSLDLTVAAAQSAGVPFALSVSNAKDAFGNFANGKILTISSDNAVAAPNGQTPVYNPITIASDGSGAANQTLTKAQSGVTLKAVAVDGGYTKTSSAITVSANPTTGSIKIHTGTTGMTTEVGDFPLATGATSQMHAVGFDYYGNSAGDKSVTWTTAGGIGTVSPLTGISTTFTASTKGTGKVTATLGSLTDDTGLITVTSSDVTVATIKIRNAPGGVGDDWTGVNKTVTADDIITLYAAGYNAAGEYLGDQVVNWSLFEGNLQSANPISGSANKLVFSPTSGDAGGTVKGKIQAQKEFSYVQTGTITVLSGAFHHYIIQKFVKVSGKTVRTEVLDDTLQIGEKLEVYSYGYDADNNPLGQIAARWTVSSGSTNGYMLPDSNTSNIKSMFYPQKVGYCIIRAFSPSDRNKYDESGIITVLAGSPRRMILTNESAGRGTEITNTTLTADQTLRIWAAAVDSLGNYAGQATPKWDIIGTLDSTFSQTEQRSYIDFSPKTAGTSGKIYAYHPTNLFTADTTGTLTITPGAPHHLRIALGQSGDSWILGDTTLTVGDDTVMLHAAGYDVDNNYKADVPATWKVMGLIGKIENAAVPNVVNFLATRSGQGLIKVEGAGLIEGYSGNITVQKGSMDYVLIRNTPLGEGERVITRTLTTDDTLRLFAAGYDAGDAFVGPAPVTWKSDSAGTLDPKINVTVPDTSLEYFPAKPGIGKIMIFHQSTGSVDTVQTVQVLPGRPFGAITLTPDLPQIPADGTTEVTITSDVIKDRKQNQVSPGTIFTIKTTAGVITTPDLDLVLPNIQVAVDGNGQIIFKLKASSGGGTATVTASGGDAQGITIISISNINLVSVTASHQFVSQGQLAVPVRMVVQNLGTSDITITEAGLKLTGAGGVNRYGEYVVTPPTNLPTLASGETEALDFKVDVLASATLETITIDGTLVTEIPGISVDRAGTTDSWLVQKPASLQVVKITTLETQVAQGERGLDVSLRVRNNSGVGGATAAVDSARPTFWYFGATDVSSQYTATVNGNLPDTLAPGQEATINFKVNVNNGAYEGEVTINGEVNGRDVNSQVAIKDDRADTTDSWRVQRAAKVQIASFITSQPTVTKNQTADWYATVSIQNNGYNIVQYDSCRLEIYKLSENISGEYTILRPDTLLNGLRIIEPESEESLKITVDTTGQRTGIMNLKVYVYLSDFGSGGNQLQDQREIQIMVQEPASLSLLGAVPSYPEATRNQGKDWFLKVALQNIGGSEVRIDTSRAKTFVLFSSGSDFIVKPPIFATTGKYSLASGATDSLVFTVDSTGAILGESNVTITLAAREVNSGHELTLTDQSVKVKIQSEPKVRIKTVTNAASNADWVNRKQNFDILVNLDNYGGLAADEVDSVHVELTSNLQTGVSWKGLMNDVRPLVDNKLRFTVTAADTHSLTEQFTAKILSAQADNTGEPVLPDLPYSDKAPAKLVKPASLVVDKFIVPDTIQARQYMPWQIRLVVRNSGQASVRFNSPTKSDISFKVVNVVQTDYDIAPPAGLNSGGLILAPGKLDTLTYTVTRTGNQPGNIIVGINITPTDLNDPTRNFAVTNTTGMYVETAAKIRITSIDPICFIKGSIGQVNVGQNFKIGVLVENGGAEGADSVYVRLIAADTNYVAYEDTVLIDYIGISQSAVAEFDAKAKQEIDEFEFTAAIISAKGHSSGLPVPIDQTGAYTAYVRIHQPSELTLSVATENGLTSFATDQEFTVKATIARTGTSQLDNSGKIEITVPTGYVILSADTVSFSVSSEIAEAEVTWRVKSPSEAKAAAPLRVTMINKPVDRYTNEPAIIAKIYAELQIEALRSSLRVSSIQFYSPEGAKDGTVSTDQVFRIKATISYSGNVSNVKTELRLPVVEANQIYKISQTDDSQRNANPAVWIWSILAPGVTVSAKDFTVQAWGTEKTTDDVTDSKTLGVTTVSRSSLAVDVKSSQGDPEEGLILSTGQSFTLTVLVKNQGVANTVGNGYVSIGLPSAGFTITEAAQKKYQVNSPVTWTITTPNIAVESQWITVKLDSIPDDENSLEPAQIDEADKIKRVSVTTLSRGVVTAKSIRIASPTGAQDLTLSTGQTFQIEATFGWNRCLGLQAKIIYPETFLCENNTKQPANPNESTGEDQTVIFNLQALSGAATNQPIKVIVSGRDAYNSSLTLRDTTEILQLNLVEQALAQIWAGLPGEISVVSVGQNFVIKTFLVNTRPASLVGNFTAVLNSGSPEFIVESNLQQTKAYNDTAEWKIQAPLSALSTQNFTVTITSWPNDENSNATAAHPNSERVIPVTTEEKNVVITRRSGITPASIVKGETNVPLLGLIFRNSGNATSNKLLLKGMRLKLKSRDGKEIVDPSTVISRIAAVHANRTSLRYGELKPVPSTTQINLQFTRNDTIFPLIPDSVNLVVDIAEDASNLNFQLAIDTTTAFDLVDEYSGRRPLFRAADGSEISSLEITSDLSVVLEAELEKSFINYPNPFGRSGYEQTKFVYYLEENADVELRIFTLLGELVWSKSFQSDEPEGQAGMHEDHYFGTGGPPILWDGRNGAGHKVLNGVYIAVLSTSKGKQATTKVAVIK